MKRILFLSPKGGSGKTTLARNVAIAAVMAGHTVATYDLDFQRGLSKWWRRRPSDRPAITHYEGLMAEITAPPVPPDPADLLIIDTPPSLENTPEAVRVLTLCADLIVVPCQATVDDVDSTVEALPFLRATGRPVVVVLNRVQARTKASRKHRHHLITKGAPIYPSDIPQLADFHESGEAGLGVAEVAGSKAGDEMEALWAYLQPLLRKEAA